MYAVELDEVNEYEFAVEVNDYRGQGLRDESGRLIEFDYLVEMVPGPLVPWWEAPSFDVMETFALASVDDSPFAGRARSVRHVFEDEAGEEPLKYVAVAIYADCAA